VRRCPRAKHGSALDRLTEDIRFEFGLEPVGLEHYWRRMTMIDSYSPKVWTDRYLAAFATTAGLQVVTFDGVHPAYDSDKVGVCWS
jgi:uncharacterized protein